MLSLPSYRICQCPCSRVRFCDSILLLGRKGSWWVSLSSQGGQEAERHLRVVLLLWFAGCLCPEHPGKPMLKTAELLSAWLPEWLSGKRAWCTPGKSIVFYCFKKFFYFTSILLIFKINIFNYFWLCWVFVAMRGLFVIAVMGYSVEALGPLIAVASLVEEDRL